MFINALDRGADGTTGIAGNARDANGHGSAFVGWISPSGLQPLVTQVTPYSTASIAVAPDGTLWTAGRELIDVAAYKAAGGTDFSPSALANPKAHVIRHFDRSGKTIGAFVPISTIRDPFKLQLPEGFKGPCRMVFGPGGQIR